MDSGYKFILSDEPWLVEDCGNYFPVHYNYKQIAAFKTKELALEYYAYKKLSDKF